MFLIKYAKPLSYLAIVLVFFGYVEYAKYTERKTCKFEQRHAQTVKENTAIKDLEKIRNETDLKDDSAVMRDLIRLNIVRRPEDR